MAADDFCDDDDYPHLLPPMRREYFELAIPLREYFEALRAGDHALREADARFLAERDRRYQEFSAERDQRYAEVKAAEEKALKVKETADLKALNLASQIQTYKDEKANELREQISNERSIYVTRNELAGAVRELQASIKPLTEYAVSQQGRTSGAADIRTGQRADRGLSSNMLVTVFIGLALLVSIGSMLLAAFKK
jgi:hypothetical protein